MQGIDIQSRIFETIAWERCNLTITRGKKNPFSGGKHRYLKLQITQRVTSISKLIIFGFSIAGYSSIILRGVSREQSILAHHAPVILDVKFNAQLNKQIIKTQFRLKNQSTYQRAVFLPRLENIFYLG